MNRILMPFFFLLAFLAGCSGTKSTECQDNAGCENQACIEGQCVDVDCLSSNECDLYEYCSDKDYTCTPGCSADSDCMAGESCDMETNTCEEYGCRDTQLDCSIGEYCNSGSGDCYDDPYGSCDLCSYAENYEDVFALYYGETLQNRHCVQWDATTYYWLALCNVNDGANACPRGFACIKDIYGDPSMRVDACIGDCDFYRQNGYL